jgi:hypothetical protein
VKFNLTDRCRHLFNCIIRLHSKGSAYSLPQVCRSCWHETQSRRWSMRTQRKRISGIMCQDWKGKLSSGSSNAKTPTQIVSFAHAWTYINLCAWWKVNLNLSPIKVVALIVLYSNLMWAYTYFLNAFIVILVRSPPKSLAETCNSLPTERLRQHK